MDMVRIGLLIAGLGNYLEQLSQKQEIAPIEDIFSEALDAGFSSTQLDGPIRQCVRKFVGPSGMVRCAEWQFNPDFVNPTAFIVEEEAALGGGWYGRKIIYQHPSTTEAGRKTFEARYKVIEADLLITSHKEREGFIEDYRFPEGVQDRDYSNPDGQDQAAVIRNAQTLNPNLVLGCSVTSSEGSPIVWVSDSGLNIVLSGNSRTMSIRYASRFHPERYDDYRAELINSSSFYGIPVSRIEEMDTPILVREVFIGEDEIGEFGSLANKPISRELDVVGKAIEVSKGIPDPLLVNLTFQTGETLRQFLQTARGRNFVQILLNNIVQTERARIFQDDGRLTQEGVIILENALFAKVFPERETVEAMTDGQKRALESALPELISIKIGIQTGLIMSSWDLTQALQDAIQFADRNLRDTPIQDYLRQARFAADEPLELDTLWGQSINLLAQHGTKPRVLRDKIAVFRREAEFEAEASLFEKEERDPAEVLRVIIQSARTDDAAALFGR